MKRTLFLILSLSVFGAIESRVLAFNEWRSYVNGPLQDPYIKVINPDGELEDLLEIVKKHGTPADQDKVLKALKKGNFDL